MSPSTDGGEGGGTGRVRSVVLTVLAAEVGVLVVTGVALYFVYEPTAGLTATDPGADGLASTLRAVHRVASVLAVPTAVSDGILVALRRRWTSVGVVVGIVAATFAALFTGYRLPWKGLALWAVNLGTEYKGYRALSDSSVRFVITRSGEHSPGTVLWWLAIHALVLTPALVVLVVLAIRRSRRDRTVGVRGASD